MLLLPNGNIGEAKIGKHLALGRPHARFLLGLCMIVSQEMQGAMHHEQLHF